MQIHNAVITGSFSYNGADLSNVTSSNQSSASLSTRVTQIEQVYATTGSNSFRATQSITGSLTVTGQIIAQTLNVQQVTSSIVYSSGSNNFGCDINSRQTFTGSFYQTGSVSVFNSCVGIGINNPNTKLHIVGSIKIADNPGVDYIGFGSNNTTAKYAYITSTNEGAQKVGLAIYTTCDAGNSNQEKLRITDAGCIGIGTTTPGFNLAINSSADCKLQLLNNSYQVGKITLENNDLNIHSTFTGNLLFKTANNTTSQGDGTSRMTILGSNGFVGIGICNPFSPLHQVYCGGAYMGEMRIGGSSTDFGIELKYDQSSATCGSIYVSPKYNSTNVYLRMGAGCGNTNQLVLQGNGSIGINCASPFATLHVCGCLRTTGANNGIATFTATFAAGAGNCFGYGNYNQGMNDNVSGLMIISISEATSNVWLNNAVWVGVVTNPRGGGTYATTISNFTGGSNINYLCVMGLGSVNGANNLYVVACSSAGVTTLRATATFIGGGGVT